MRRGNAGFGREQSFASWTMWHKEEGAEGIRYATVVLDKGRMCVLSPTAYPSPLILVLVGIRHH